MNKKRGREGGRAAMVYRYTGGTQARERVSADHRNQNNAPNVNFPQHRKMPWPAHSSDLDPIENVWAMLKKRRKKRFRKPCPHNQREVVEVAQEEGEKTSFEAHI